MLSGSLRRPVSWLCIRTMSVDLFTLKQTTFVLWRPKNTSTPPKLVIGEFSPGTPPSLANSQTFDLALLPGKTDLWGIAASSCGLSEGKVYHYWFEVSDSNPARNGSRIRCTDPTVFSVDWRLQTPPLPSPYDQDDVDAASVIKFVGGNLIPCDAGGETFSPA